MIEPSNLELKLDEIQTLTDISWAAGLFEGEGTIRIARTKRENSISYILTLSMTMTDKQCVETFVEIIDGWYSNHHLETETKKASYICMLHSQRASKAIEQMSPFFKSDRVKEKAKLGLEFQNQKVVGYPARDPDYKIAQEKYFNMMKTLNRRGVQHEHEYLDSIIADLDLQIA